MLTRSEWYDFKHCEAYKELDLEMKKTLEGLISELASPEADFNRVQYLRGFIRGLSEVHDFEPELAEGVTNENEGVRTQTIS